MPQTDPTNCIFCEIVAGEAPADVVREWPDALAIRPLDPVTEGHLLVIPKTHVTDLATDPWTTAMVMHHAADLVAHPRRLWDCNVITSAGRNATQTVFHLHVHIVPRRAGDGLLLPWSNQVPDGPNNPCQGRCEFHGILWCKDTGRSCQEFMDAFDAARGLSRDR